MNPQWTLIDAAYNFAGPQDSGAQATYPVHPGTVYKVTVMLNERWWPKRPEDKPWATRVQIVLKHGWQTIWHFDFMIRGTEMHEIYIPVHPDTKLRDEDAQYTLTIDLTAFIDTPASIDYKLEAWQPELPPSEYIIAYTNSARPTPSSAPAVYPRELRIPKGSVRQEFIIKNISPAPCTVTVTDYDARGFWAGYKTYHLAADAEEKFFVFENHSAIVTVTSTKGYGYIVVLPSSQQMVPEDIKVTSGDEIRPDEHPWVGSLGLELGGVLLTNAHVCPYPHETVFLPRLDNIKLGIVKNVANIRTISRLDMLLNMFFNIKLPANKLDVAAIAPERYIKYVPFRDYPAQIVEPRVGMKVYSRGRTSGEREGIIRDINATIVVPWPHAKDKYAIFTDCIVIDMPTRPGDSGSLVVTDEGVVGLIFAGTADNSTGIAIKATNIAEWLNLKAEQKINKRLKLR